MKKIEKLGNWKHCPSKGWPYKGAAPDDTQYIKDRNKLFKENGNGWWWTQGAPMWRRSLDNIKKRKQSDKVEG